VFGGYLHSDYSSTLRLVLERDGDGRDRLVLSHEINPLAAAIAQRAVRALARLWRPLRGVPVLPMVRVKDPGTAYHFGGSFPMTSRPLRSFESDRLGRPRGFSRVFLTDASNFPTIPASTITFNAMANAYRIALASTRGNPV
jgi:choline dehydrogenase-like flavoprotein